MDGHVMNTHCLVKWTNSNPSVHNAGTRDSICLPVITKVLRLQVFNMQHVATVAGCHQVAVRGLDGERVAEPQHLIKGSAEQIEQTLEEERCLGFHSFPVFVVGRHPCKLCAPVWSPFIYI